MNENQLDRGLLTPFGSLVARLMGATPQGEFARKIGVPPQTLSNWLTGKVDKPQDKNLEGLAALSGMSIAKLRGTIVASNRSFDEMAEAFQHPISDPARMLANRLDVFRRELQESISTVSLARGQAEVKEKLESLQQVVGLYQDFLEARADQEPMDPAVGRK